MQSAKVQLERAEGGPVRVGWFKGNIQIALATLLNGMGGTEI
jgi:hypothetical protein